MDSIKSNYNLTKEAYKSLIKKRYGYAISLLESATTGVQYDPYPLFLLTVAYLFADKFDKADNAMRKIKAIDSEFIPLIQLQTFVNLKSSQNLKQAVSVYVELMEKYPGDPYIFRGLKLLRSVDNFQEFQKNSRLVDFVNIPKPPKNLKMKRKYKRAVPKKKYKRKHSPMKLFKYIIIFIALSICSYAAVYLYESDYFNDLTNSMKVKSLNIREVDMVTLSGSNYEMINKINRKKVPEFYYNSQKMTADFSESKKLIKSEKYNKALEILNKIYNSNASFNVKEKVNFLIKFVSDVEYRTFEGISYKKIYDSPYLYRGYAIKWKGRVTNLKKKNGKHIFTLLVNYKDKDIFSGIADIFFDKIVDNLTNGNNVEVNGIFINTLGNDKRIYIIAKGIRSL